MRSQAADWLQGGLDMPAPLGELLRDMSLAFGRAVVDDTLGRRELDLADRLLEEEIGTEAFVEYGDFDRGQVQPPVADSAA